MYTIRYYLLFVDRKQMCMHSIDSMCIKRNVPNSSAYAFCAIVHFHMRTWFLCRHSVHLVSLTEEQNNIKGMNGEYFVSVYYLWIWRQEKENKLQQSSQKFSHNFLIFVFFFALILQLYLHHQIPMCIESQWIGGHFCALRNCRHWNWRPIRVNESPRIACMHCLHSESITSC